MLAKRCSSSGVSKTEHQKNTAAKRRLHMGKRNTQLKFMAS